MVDETRTQVFLSSTNQDAAAFAKSFHAWWDSMVVKVVEGDWGVLHTGGGNRFLVVMLLLCWWGRAETSATWIASVDEAKVYLIKMSSVKRALDTPDADTRKSACTY
jgi:hypothetical protein